MRAPHVNVQCEQLEKVKSELHDLVKKRQKWEKAFPGLSDDHEKLEKVRTTAQTNPMLQLIHVAHKNLVSKTAEVDKVKQGFQSTRSKLEELDTEHKKQSARKNVHVEQVLQILQRHSHSNMSFVLQSCKRSNSAKQ